MSNEKKRLKAIKDGTRKWQHWGPYLSERSWGTVREDYSADGEAWDFLTHDMARSKAYRWGEDGLAGICDRYQILNFALAVWNGKDPILKERPFGLTPREGNHGEDVKDYYFYLDSTPTHSYMRYLYKYPQTEFPYADIIKKNQERHGQGQEYELLDTGIFDDDRYFDVFVEYAKVSEEDICIRIEAFNRGSDSATIHILPHIWFRNTWNWETEPQNQPNISLKKTNKNATVLLADDTTADGIRNLPFEYFLGKRLLYGDRDGVAMFTNNETHRSRVYGENPDQNPAYCKDAFHRHIINGEETLNPSLKGTKACIHYTREVAAGQSTVVRLRLTPENLKQPLADVDKYIKQLKNDADEFYSEIQPKKASEDEIRIQRQAFAGLLWSKQAYIFDVKRWMDGDDPSAPPPKSRYTIRNQHWRHLNSMRILSMPDKWEYPWFAAWDLAFHTIPIALVDSEFSKEQLWYLLFEQFQHPNGQIPAYEWEFSDLNPPVHAWAVWRIYNMDRIRNDKPDHSFLERCFHKLMINFTWWVNKVDSLGNNIFEGGFLGLDNITVFDRSENIPDGSSLEQADATGWMGMFCLNMMRIALELSKDNDVYESLATKFFQHYIYIGAAMKHMGGHDDYNLWDEKDGFFYDVLRYEDGNYEKLKVRSLVGLIPLFAVERLERSWIEPFKSFTTDLDWFLNNRQDVTSYACHRVQNNKGDNHVLTIVNLQQISRILQRVWDSNEFRSDFGMRSLSKIHQSSPFIMGENRVDYEPAEAISKLKGGNSNWRGPIWFPTTFLMIESLRKLGKAYGDTMKIRLDDGKEVMVGDIAEHFANGMIDIFSRNGNDYRPVYGDCDKFQNDPQWRDYILFYEYFHGDSGLGLGASHQTGWTGLVASLIDEWRN